MHKFTLNLHGCKVGTRPPLNFKPPKNIRGICAGWSQKSVRNNIDFLRKIKHNDLTGIAVTFTGTVLLCPDTSDEWHSARRAFIKRLERRGLIRLHWVTEWQRRGVPHAHMAIFMEGDKDSVEDENRVSLAIWQAWLDCFAEYKPGMGGQHIKIMTDAMGWFQYVSKHAARGVNHYQRSPENVPRKWRMKTGRVWGKIGDWVLHDGVTVTTDQETFHRFRRSVRKWREADSRSCKHWRRLSYARKMLSCNKKGLSSVRGLSEWIDIDTSTRLLTHALSLSSNPTLEYE